MFFLGSAHSADRHRQAVPQEAIRDAGVGAAGPQPGHSGESHFFWILKLLRFSHQLILTLAPLQDSDNPDLRDRGYIYWRLLSTDPVTAKEVVLSEKPLISEETDLIEPTLLDELICHIGSLASVYHKPPSAFVEGSHGIHRKHLPVQHSRSATRTFSLIKLCLIFVMQQLFLP